MGACGGDEGKKEFRMYYGHRAGRSAANGSKIQKVVKEEFWGLGLSSWIDGAVLSIRLWIG